MTRLVCTLVIVTLFLHSLAQADDPATVEQARQTIGRSLPFIEREGVAWKDKRKCVTCHQVSTLVWSFNEARRQGFEVDSNKLKEWSEWSLNNAFGGNRYYKLPDQAYEKLEKEGFDAESLAKLQPLKNQEFVTESEFLDAVAKLVTPETALTHKAVILKSAAKPGFAPGSAVGDSAALNVMLRSGAAAETASPERSLAALFEGLRANQQADGIWKTSGQFLAMNRPKEESNLVNTMWIVLALTKHEPLPEPLVQARNRAQQAIQKAPPGVSTESLMLRTLLAHSAEKPAAGTPTTGTPSGDELLEQLLKAQRADGGWAWLIDPQTSPNSDPLTTGQVLYALGVLGRSQSDPHMQRAWSYLSRTQQADGSWSVPWLTFMVENNKDHADGDKVFSYWGTTWSALGLLSTLSK